MRTFSFLTAARTPRRIRLGMWSDGFPAAATVAAHEASTSMQYAVVRAFRGADGGDLLHDDVIVSAGTGPTGLGKLVCVAWDMGSTAAFNFASWARGDHDAYLAEVAKYAKERAHTLVHVAPWSEMNGDWAEVAFQPGTTRSAAGTVAEFVAAWRHVVDYFRNAGVTNVRWVFCPTVDTYDGTTDVRTIWPGTDYVDVLGLDGYCWGGGGQPEWAAFEATFAAQYDRLVSLHPTAPVWVCEVGCSEPSVDDGAPVDSTRSKAAWVHDMAARIPVRFPRIETVIWFSERKERDWRVDSCPSALGALRACH